MSTFSTDLSLYTLIAHESNQGGMFDGNGDLKPTYSYGAYNASPIASTRDFEIPFSAGSQTKILFVTGDLQIWALADYTTLRNLIDAKGVDINPNIDFSIYNGSTKTFSETKGNILSRDGALEDPWISISGGHYDGISNGMIAWGENDYNASHTALKNNHGGINVYILNPNPTYSLNTSASSINEGSTLTTTVKTTNVNAGTTLYYSLSGAGITAFDFSSGALLGWGVVNDSGTFSFSHTIANDLTTEGTETLNIKLFSDSNLTSQVGSTASLTINDTSTTPASTISINGSNNGIANTGTINNSGTINTGTQVTNITNITNNTTNNISNTNVNNSYVYYNSNNTTYNSWNTYYVDNSVKAQDIVAQWFPSSQPIAQSQDLTDTKYLDVAASTWSDKVKLKTVAQAASTGSQIESSQINFDDPSAQGSVLNGSTGNDQIYGKAGWDVLDGGVGNDLIHGGNGRDIITGGVGADELHGDFGWNTYKSEKDGSSDLIAIKSDQWLVNWMYGKAGNNPNGEKADIIEGLDSVDQIRIVGVYTSDLTFQANATAHGVSGIGIYAKGALEALYTGGDLSVNQIKAMTSGDASTAAMNNNINSYGWTQHPGTFTPS